MIFLLQPMGASLCTVYDEQWRSESEDRDAPQACATKGLKLEQKTSTAVPEVTKKQSSLSSIPSAVEIIHSGPTVDMLVVGTSSHNRKMLLSEIMRILNFQSVSNSTRTVEYQNRTYAFYESDDFNKFVADQQSNSSKSLDLKGLVLISTRSTLYEDRELLHEMIKCEALRGLPLLIFVVEGRSIYLDLMANSSTQTTTNLGSHATGSRSGSIPGSLVGGGSPQHIVQRELIRQLGLNLVGRQWHIEALDKIPNFVLESRGVNVNNNNNSNNKNLLGVDNGSTVSHQEIKGLSNEAASKNSSSSRKHPQLLNNTNTDESEIEALLIKAVDSGMDALNYAVCSKFFPTVTNEDEEE